MPPESEAPSGRGFRAFLLFIGLIIVGFIGWLVWAAVSFAPTAEKDVGKSLIASPLFNREFSITNQPSMCGQSGDVKGNIPADLVTALRAVNDSQSQAHLELHRFRKEKRILDGSKSAEGWFYELNSPVMNVSNVGLVDNRALVCLELYSTQGYGMFVVLEHAGADYWRIVQSESTWQVKGEEPAEEIPELRVPSF